MADNEQILMKMNRPASAAPGAHSDNSRLTSVMSVPTPITSTPTVSKPLSTAPTRIVVTRSNTGQQQYASIIRLPPTTASQQPLTASQLPANAQIIRVARSQLDARPDVVRLRTPTTVTPSPALVTTQPMSASPARSSAPIVRIARINPQQPSTTQTFVSRALPSKPLPTAVPVVRVNANRQIIGGASTSSIDRPMTTCQSMFSNYTTTAVPTMNRPPSAIAKMATLLQKAVRTVCSSLL